MPHSAAPENDEQLLARETFLARTVAVRRVSQSVAGYRGRIGKSVLLAPRNQQAARDERDSLGLLTLFANDETFRLTRSHKRR